MAMEGLEVAGVCLDFESAPFPLKLNYFRLNAKIKKSTEPHKTFALTSGQSAVMKAISDIQLK